MKTSKVFRIYLSLSVYSRRWCKFNLCSQIKGKEGNENYWHLFELNCDNQKTGNLLLGKIILTSQRPHVAPRAQRGLWPSPALDHGVRTDSAGLRRVQDILLRPSLSQPLHRLKEYSSFQYLSDWWDSSSINIMTIMMTMTTMIHSPSSGLFCCDKIEMLLLQTASINWKIPDGI